MRLENTFLFIDGVGVQTERRLWAAGMTHWDACRPSAVDGIGTKRQRAIERTLDRARVALEDADTGYFDTRLPGTEGWRMYENFEPETCFLDIETTGLSQVQHHTTTVSVYRGGETKTFVRDHDLSGDVLQDILGSAPLLVTFNGARFDLPFLREEFDLDLDTPHLDLLSVCRRLGLTGGLKAVERTLGIDRPVDDVDGREAVRLWHRYRGGDEDALDRLIRYNRVDAANLQPLARRLTTMLDRRVFGHARSR